MQKGTWDKVLIRAMMPLSLGMMRGCAPSKAESRVYIDTCMLFLRQINIAHDLAVPALMQGFLFLSHGQKAADGLETLQRLDTSIPVPRKMMGLFVAETALKAPPPLACPSILVSMTAPT